MTHIEYQAQFCFLGKIRKCHLFTIYAFTPPTPPPRPHSPPLPLPLPPSPLPLPLPPSPPSPPPPPPTPMQRMELTTCDNVPLDVCTQWWLRPACAFLQTAHSFSLIRGIPFPLKKPWIISCSKNMQWRLIILHGYTSWSELLFVVQTFQR